MDSRIRVDRRFAIIDEWVLDLDISDRALRLYALLMRYADKDTHKAFPARRTLAERLKCSPASVDRASNELIAAGLMSKEQRYNNSLVYTLHTSSPVQTPIVTHDDTLSSPVMTAIVTGDDLTITTQLEPKNKNHLNKAKPKNADEYQPSQTILDDFETRYPGLRLEDELEKFRDHHMAAGSNFKDWDRAMRKWLRQASEWSKDARAAKARQMADDDWERFKRENGLDDED